MSLTKQGILNHHSKVFDFLNRGLDMGIIAGTFVFAHYMNSTELDLSCTLMVLTALVYFELSAAMTGIYGSQRGYSTFQHLGNVVPALVTMFLLTICTALLLNRSQHLWLEPMLTTHWVMTCTVLMIGWRFSLRQLLVFLRKRGMNTRRVAIAGCSATAKSLADKIRNNPWMGLKIDGFYDDTTACHYVPIKGDFKKLLARVNQGLVEQVYIVLPSQEATKISTLVDALSDSTATVFIIPDVFTFELMNSRQTSIDGIPAISIYDSPFSLGDSVLKRAFDIAVSLCILIMISPLMLAIAAAVKLTSPGPAIFRQRRYGMDGKAIDVWKFRSMTVEDNGPLVKQATRNDSRITPLGAFLRRTSLDELPQFINVLQGSMSIVGPRPHAVAHNEEYRKQIKGYMLRHKVKPGITGWAQINGWRGETDSLEKMEKRVEHDLHYIRHWNIWLDVQILFFTIFKGFVGKNVY